MVTLRAVSVHFYDGKPRKPRKKQTKCSSHFVNCYVSGLYRNSLLRNDFLEQADFDSLLPSSVWTVDPDQNEKSIQSEQIRSFLPAH